MRLERQSPGGGSPATGVWVGSVLLVGAASAWLWLQLGLPLPQCGFRSWTGLSCATCGTTRMARALLDGHVLQAAAWNPLSFVALASLSAWSAYSALRLGFRLPGWRVVLDARERRVVGILALLALVAGWAYQIHRGI